MFLSKKRLTLKMCIFLINCDLIKNNCGLIKTLLAHNYGFYLRREILSIKKCILIISSILSAIILYNNIIVEIFFRKSSIIWFN